MIGAINRVTVSRHSYRVANAEVGRRRARGPSQNRRRDRRTYQLDRSSRKPAIRRPVPAVSKPSISSVTSRTSVCSSLSTQRSSTGRCAGAGASPSRSGPQALPSAAAALAYRVRNETVFQ